MGFSPKSSAGLAYFDGVTNSKPYVWYVFIYRDTNVTYIRRATAHSLRLETWQSRQSQGLTSRIDNPQNGCFGLSLRS